jgi:hypothetical protein
MTDAELIEQAIGLPPVYVDGFGAYRKLNGVLRCIGYVLESGAQLNLIVSLAGADQAQLDTQRVLREEPTKGAAIWNGYRLPH